MCQLLIFASENRKNIENKSIDNHEISIEKWNESTRFNYEINAPKIKKNRCRPPKNFHSLTYLTIIPLIFLVYRFFEQSEEIQRFQKCKNPSPCKRREENETPGWSRQVAGGIVPGSRRKRSHEGAINTLRHLHLTSTYLRTRQNRISEADTPLCPMCFAPINVFFLARAYIQTCSFVQIDLSFLHFSHLLLLNIYLDEKCRNRNLFPAIIFQTYSIIPFKSERINIPFQLFRRK